MFKHILVPATGATTDAPVFATALLVARTFQAHIEFLHVKIDVTDVIISMTSGGVGGGIAEGVVERLEADNKAQETKAWQAFTTFCADAGIAAGGGAPGAGLCADMMVETGNTAQWLAEYGRFADLVVVGRKREGEDAAMDVLEAALMDTGKPLLIAPAVAPASLAGMVVIAWKDTAEAARAVAAALPFIAIAERVLIVSIDEEDDASDASGERLHRALRWHNKNVAVRHLQRGGRAPVVVLLEVAKAEGTSLLVMGGYSHSRLREVVFGGFTQSILRDADLAVLIAH